MKESKIEKILKDGVEKQLKGLCIKLLPFLFTGLPDRLLLIPGGIIAFAETKSSTGQLRPRQIYVTNQLRKLGFRVYIINSVETVNKCLYDLQTLAVSKFHD